jgi:DNA repair exonuclease SbcCD nuclease subunit
LKLLLFADAHLRAKGPPSRIDDYPYAILGKIAFVRDLAEQYGVDATIFLGDLFHFKDPSRTPPWLLSAAIRVFRSFPTPPYILLGNHDLQSGGVVSLGRQPIDVLLQAGVVARVARTYFKSHALTFLDYDSLVALQFDGLLPSPEPGMVNILFTHLDMGVLGSDSVVAYDQLCGRGYDMVFNGHMHKRVAPRDIGATRLFQVPAIARPAIPQEGEERPCVVYVEDSRVDLIEVPHRPTSEIFRLEEASDARDSQSEIAAFVAQVSALNLATTQSDMLAPLMGKVDPLVIDCIREFLDQA